MLLSLLFALSVSMAAPCGPDDTDSDTVADVAEDVNANGDCDDDDTDGDGLPNYVDDDDDGDGIPTFYELSVAVLQDPDGDGIPNHLDLDSDGDGFLDVDEGVSDRDSDGLGDFADPACQYANDRDGDRVFEDEEQGVGAVDTELDSDGDGVDDRMEWGPGPDAQDTDGDLIPDIADPDDDGDGLNTRTELGQECAAGVVAFELQCPENGPGAILAVCPNDVVIDPRVLRDTDGDALPDYLDPDSDGDGVLDADEAPGDTDCDGTLDVLDADDADGPCAPVATGAGTGTGTGNGTGTGTGGAAPERAEATPEGCGCAGSPDPMGGLAWLALPALLLGRRRVR